MGEIRKALARDEDARALLRRLFVTPANLRPDPAAKTLTVQLHRLGSPLQDAAVALPTANRFENSLPDH